MYVYKNQDNPNVIGRIRIFCSLFLSNFKNNYYILITLEKDLSAIFTKIFESNLIISDIINIYFSFTMPATYFIFHSTFYKFFIFSNQESLNLFSEHFENTDHSEVHGRFRQHYSQ